jgi:uncharacterized UPF0160 family protein
MFVSFLSSLTSLVEVASFSVSELTCASHHLFLPSPTWQARFQKASTLTGTEFLEKLSYLAEAWLPARSIIQSAFNKRFDAHPSGKILIFDEFAPWKEHLFELEAEMGLKEEEKPVSQTPSRL